jgi:hypothetical protein
MKADLSSQQITNFSILVGAILVAFLCSILLISSTLFIAGIAISRFHVPVAALMAAGFGWWAAAVYFPEHRTRAFGLAFGSSVIAVACFAVINRNIYDTSWDGQEYHAEAILQLINGWNPFKDAVPQGVPSPVRLRFYAKGSWIAAAALNTFIGDFEAGKALHLILMLVSWLCSLAAVSTFAGLAWPYRVMISLVLAISPVSICQMFTYYVDGQLSSLLISAVGLLILLDRRPDRVLMATLMLVVVVTINVKLNGAVYIGIITIGYWAWYVLLKRERWREFGAWLLAGGVVGGAFIGFNPYLNEFFSRLYTNRSAVSVPAYLSVFRTSVPDASVFRTSVPDAPPNFFGKGRFEQLLISLFSKSEVLFWSPDRPSRLKLPFTVSQDEIQVFWAPDVRTGGFGPLFSGALILALLILVTYIWKHRHAFKDNIALLVLVVLTILSATPNPIMWWARYAPQFWMVPALIGLIGCSFAGPAPLRSLALILFLTLSINYLFVASTNVRATRYASRAVWEELNQLQAKSEVITVQFNGFAAARYRLQQQGLRFVAFNQLPCDNDKRRKLAHSEAVICQGN